MLNIYVVTPLEAVSDQDQDAGAAADMFKNISKLGQVQLRMMK